MKFVLAASLATIVAAASLAGVASACPLEKPVTATSGDEEEAGS